MCCWLGTWLNRLSPSRNLKTAVLLVSYLVTGSILAAVLLFLILMYMESGKKEHVEIDEYEEALLDLAYDIMNETRVIVEEKEDVVIGHVGLALVMTFMIVCIALPTVGVLTFLFTEGT